MFVEGYLKLNNVFGQHYPSTNDEKGFYLCCIVIVLEQFLLSGILYGLTGLTGSRISWRLFWKGLTLANFSKLLFVPIMIWREQLSHTEIQINYVLIMAYYLLTTICACSGETNIITFSNILQCITVISSTVVSKQTRGYTVVMLLGALLCRGIVLSQVEPFLINAI